MLYLIKLFYFRSLKSSVTCLIETLIILSDDEQHEVEIAAKKSFENLHTMFDGKNKKSLMELLEESFYLLLSRMPLYIRTSSKNKLQICVVYIFGLLIMVFLNFYSIY